MPQGLVAAPAIRDHLLGVCSGSPTGRISLGLQEVVRSFYGECRIPPGETIVRRDSHLSLASAHAFLNTRCNYSRNRRSRQRRGEKGRQGHLPQPAAPVQRAVHAQPAVQGALRAAACGRPVCCCLHVAWARQQRPCVCLSGLIPHHHHTYTHTPPYHRLTPATAAALPA